MDGMTWSKLVLACSLGLATGACGSGDEGEAAPEVPVDFFALLADPYAPARRPIGQARVASSRSPEDPSGFHNRDWANYERIDGDLGTILDERGPGVITRLWLTQRSSRSAPAVEEDLVIRMWIDGQPVEWTPGRPAVGLRELTAGDAPALPEPWVAGPAEASGSFLVTVPIQFQRSIRIALEIREGFDSYWWIDWRKLPRGSVVRSFDGTLTEDERASLDVAAALWSGDDPAATSSVNETREIGPGESVEVTHAVHGVLRSFAIEPATAPQLEVRLQIDGLTVADAPVDRLALAAAPAASYRSALSALDGARATLRFPAPVREDVRVLLRNGGDEPVTATWDLAWDDVEPPDDLGDLRIDCTSAVGVESTNVTVAALEGRGHVAGHFLRLLADGWGFAVLEGDPEIWADDRALLGTGIEDLFGGAHYFIYGPFAQPEQGLSGIEDRSGGYPQLAMYRHMIASGVDFEERLEWEYEVFDPGSTYDACTYWYAD